MEISDARQVPATLLPSARPYFGWRIVAALFLCTSSLIGVAMYSFIIFGAPLSAQFGWTRAETGTLVSAMWLAGPVALFMAPLIERFGAWRLVFLGMAAQVAALAVVGLIGAFWQLYLLRILMGVGKVIVMTSAPVIVAQWFQRRFATSMAIVWAGGAAGGIVMAPLTETLSSALGWRAAALALSAVLAFSIAAAGLLARGASSPARLAERRVEGFGIPGAAHRHEGAADRGEDDIASPGMSWAQVARSLDWPLAALMCVSVVGAGMVAIAVQSQEPAYLAQAGLSSSGAAAMLGLTAAAALAGSAGAGWLLDRLHILWTTVSAALAMVAGLACFWLVMQTGLPAFGAVAACAVGYALGAGDVIWITLFKRQFGVAAFAVTYGLFYFSLQVGFASGGFIGGWSFADFGPGGFLLVCAAIYAPAIIFTFWRPRGKRPAAPGA